MTGVPPADATQEPLRQTRLRRMLKIVAYIFVVVVVLGFAAAAGLYLGYDYTVRPRPGGSPVVFVVPEGATGLEVARLLAKEGLVEHEYFMRAAMRLMPSSTTIKHGEYYLPTNLSPVQYLERLREGPESSPRPGAVPDELKVTVPEGLSIAQASKLFENPEAFVQAASNTTLISDLGVNVANLEGFLMPNTYFFAQKPTESDVVARMVEQFKKDFAKLRKDYPESSGRDILELVTVASLVEEEARAHEERPLVAAVIYNRIEKNMPLGLDATLQFALNKYGQRMLDVDKAVDSLYNTYMHTGLPPGPICSPGIESLKAALRPASEGYLYFVSNADGKTHTFSKTMDEHNRAVAKYRREIAVQRREERRSGDGQPQ